MSETRQIKSFVPAPFLDSLKRLSDRNMEVVKMRSEEIKAKDAAEASVEAAEVKAQADAFKELTEGSKLEPPDAQKVGSDWMSKNIQELEKAARENFKKDAADLHKEMWKGVEMQMEIDSLNSRPDEKSPPAWSPTETYRPNTSQYINQQASKDAAKYVIGDEFFDRFNALFGDMNTDFYDKFLDMTEDQVRQMAANKNFQPHILSRAEQMLFKQDIRTRIEEEFGTKYDKNTIGLMVNAAVDAGINYFDDKLKPASKEEQEFRKKNSVLERRLTELVIDDELKKGNVTVNPLDSTTLSNVQKEQGKHQAVFIAGSNSLSIVDKMVREYEGESFNSFNKQVSIILEGVRTRLGGKVETIINKINKAMSTRDKALALELIDEFETVVEAEQLARIQEIERARKEGAEDNFSIKLKEDAITTTTALNKLFTVFRGAITGAQASFKELQWLKDTLLDPEGDATKIRAQLRFWVADSASELSRLGLMAASKHNFPYNSGRGNTVYRTAVHKMLMNQFKSEPELAQWVWEYMTSHLPQFKNILPISIQTEKNAN